MTGRDLDSGQGAVVAALAGDRSLIVVEGAAGAGKTTGSAAWLAYQHGWRWATDGSWTRLTPGDLDPVSGKTYVAPVERATLRSGDLLIVDEAGMLDQDTARALLMIADEHQVRMALVGDRHQLSAVGRGGVLDLAARWADRDACLTLDVVHRFTRDIAEVDGGRRTVPDVEYAELTGAMRTGADPGAVFDALIDRGQIRLHPSVVDLQAAIAETAAHLHAGGERSAVVVDTREQAAALNAAIRERMVATGQVEDVHATTAAAGQRIGVRDQVATRRNDRDLNVANRDIWTVTAIDRNGRLTVTNRDAGLRVLPAAYVHRHVELAYASTTHGVQGDTVSLAHVVVGEHTGAASAYVGMTRGRTSNIAHLVAADTADARAQWLEVFTRDRADLGAAHAAELAAREADTYARTRPLDQVLGELRAAWAHEARCAERLEWHEPRRDALREIVALERTQAAELAAVENHFQHVRSVHDQAIQRVDRSEALIAAETARHASNSTLRGTPIVPPLTPPQVS
jgi:exodeoxyribonuclease V alpha subunit